MSMFSRVFWQIRIRNFFYQMLTEVNIMSSVFRDGQKVDSLLIKDGKDIEAGIKEAL